MKVQIEEVAKNYANYNEQSKKATIESVIFGYNHAKQTLYSEDEISILLETFKLYLGCGDEIDHKEWFNKHKKQ